MNEQQEAMDQVRLEQAAAVLNSEAQRQNLASMTRANEGLTRVYEARAAMRTTWRRLGVLAGFLAAAWTALAWVRWG